MTTLTKQRFHQISSQISRSLHNSCLVSKIAKGCSAEHCSEQFIEYTRTTFSFKLKFKKSTERTTLVENVLLKKLLSKELFIRIEPFRTQFITCSTSLVV